MTGDLNFKTLMTLRRPEEGKAGFGLDDTYHHHSNDHHCHNLPFLRLPSNKLKRSFNYLSTYSKTPLRDMKPYAPGFFGSLHPASIPVDDID